MTTRRPASLTLNSPPTRRAPVACGTAVTGLGSGAVTAQIKDFRFYVSDVKLIRADGSTAALKLGANDDWNRRSAATRDADRPRERHRLLRRRHRGHQRHAARYGAGGHLRGRGDAMGVPFALNHTDTAAAPKPLDIQAMTWSWQAGRKFAKIELTDPAGTPGTWSAKPSTSTSAPPAAPAIRPPVPR